MKGVVFTEFLGFVAESFGEDAVDDIIDASRLPSGGAYTSVGTYAHAEMTSLCDALSKVAKEPASQLVCRFGSRLSETFARDYSEFFAKSSSFFDFIASVEDHIHVEVLKLYPDAELPNFKVVSRTDSEMVLDYQSPRRMSNLAEGLILGSARQFGVTVQVTVLPDPNGDADTSRFIIKLVS
jgi:Haem-NO-binding